MRDCFLIFAISLNVLGTPAKADFACSKIEKSYDYNGSLPTVNSKETFSSDVGIVPGGEITCEDYYDNRIGQNKRIRTETGTYKGVKYELYYPEGKGKVQGVSTNTLDILTDNHEANWSLVCEIDGMDDTHFCSLIKKHLQVLIWNDGTIKASVGFDHYPGSNVSVRIDKNKPISASEASGFSDSQSMSIVEQLKTGQSALTRYQEWPYGVNIDSPIDLFGFGQAWEIMTIVYDSLDQQ